MAYNSFFKSVKDFFRDSYTIKWDGGARIGFRVTTRVLHEKDVAATFIIWAHTLAEAYHIRVLKQILSNL